MVRETKLSYADRRMKHEHKPRRDDHLVEPMYHALHDEPTRGEKGAGASREPEGDWRWRIVWLVVGALAIGYVVWRQAF